MKYNSILAAIKHYYPIIFLTFIFCVGLWLRTIALERTMWQGLGNDTSRDILVANHILEGETSLKRGPFANGGLGWLQNSPRYYWVVAALWAVSGSAYSVTLVWAAITSICIPLGYYIGKKYFDSLHLGILFATFLAIHPRLIYLSHFVIQPNLTAYWSILLIISLLASIQKNTLPRLLIFLTIVAIPLHLHYAVFLLLPICFVWFIYLWHDLLVERLSLLRVIAPPFLGVFLFLDWIFATYKVAPFDQIFFVLLNYERANQLGIWEKSRLMIQVFANSWIGSQYHLPFFYGVLAIGTFNLLLFTIGKRYPKKTKLKVMAIFSFVVSASISLFFNGFLYESYLDIFIIPTCLLLALGFCFIMKYSKSLGTLLAICLIYFWYTSNNMFFYPQKIFPMYEYLGNVTNVIDYDYQSRSPNLTNTDKKYKPNYVLFALDPKMAIQFDGWSTASIWYLLEEKYDTPLVRLSEGGVNISPLTTSPDYAYVICTYYDNLETGTNFCKQVIKYYKPYLYLEPTLIYQDNLVLIFRYPFVPNIYIPSSRYYETIIAKDFYSPDKVITPTAPSPQN